MGSILHFVFRIDTIIMIGLSAQWSSLLRSETINFTRNWLLDFLNLFTNSCSGSLPRQAHPDPLIFGAGGKSRPSTWGSLAWSSVLHTSAVKDVEVTTVKFPLLFQIARVKSKVRRTFKNKFCGEMASISYSWERLMPAKTPYFVQKLCKVVLKRAEAEQPHQPQTIPTSVSG
jgi:hypothetical protein